MCVCVCVCVCSTSLLGHQPFLCLVFACLKGQDEQREGLLKSLHDQLDKFVTNTKEEQDRGMPTDDKLKFMMQEALQLRLSLVRRANVAQARPGKACKRSSGSAW